ncbi:MAG TPA: sigma-70 family RNA polymerase sigma factor [Ktedonobacteraceae bacterium]|jgi:RNA polymerase sigma-70 factor (ECF subfamily)|nr:sigma-70 family RNA polymerase sigma factor [Ktedonobacteraceae bacterium]
MDDDISALPQLLAADLNRHFPTLARTYQHALYSFALRLGNNFQDAEDIVQEALLRSYIALSQYPTASIRNLNLRPWLYKITFHVFCKQQRRTYLLTFSLEDRGEHNALDVPDDELVQPEVLYELAESRQELENAVQRLAAHYRDVIVCVYFEHLSYQETATLLDLALGTVRSRLHRGLKQLHQHLCAERNPRYGVV